MNTSLPPLAVTMGDPSGIGPEIVAKTMLARTDLRRSVVVGDPAVMAKAIASLSGGLNLNEIHDIADAKPDGVLNILAASRIETPPALGKVSATSGRMAYDAIVAAIELASTGKVAGIVTAPIHKEALAAAGLPRSACPSCAQAPTTALPSISPAAALPIREVSKQRSTTPADWRRHRATRRIDVTPIDFIFMLTRNDRTIPDALAQLPLVLSAGVRHIGFKDIGLPFEVLSELKREIRAAGAKSYLEVVSLDRASEIASVRAALRLGVDYLLGGTHVDDVLPLLKGSGMRYYPFPGPLRAIRAFWRVP